MVKLATIGFSKKTLKEFVELLRKSNVTCLVDTRLNNTSQLSGFAKKNDLSYILEEFLKIRYIHRIELAPTQDILSDFKNKVISWEEYAIRYKKLLSDRKVEENMNDYLSKDKEGATCFLCSEHKPHHCHRSLLVDYLKEHLNDKEEIKIVHLY